MFGSKEKETFSKCTITFGLVALNDKTLTGQVNSEKGKKIKRREREK